MSDELATLTKTLGRPIDTGCRLIESLLGKPITVASEIVADQLQAWQWSNRISIAERAAKLLEEKSIASRVIPPAFLVPLLQQCGDIDDKDLQEAWAHLLTAAVEDDEAQRVAYIYTLKQLSPIDVRVLDWMMQHEPMKRGEERTQAVAMGCKLSDKQVAACFGNFQHLGFFSPTSNRFRPFALSLVEFCLGDAEATAKYRASQEEIPRKILHD